MPQDKLTESFRDMLGESGITASDTDIGSFLGEKLDIFDDDDKRKGKNPYYKFPLRQKEWDLQDSFPSSTAPMPFEEGQRGQVEITPGGAPKGNLLTAVGTGLWSFLDTYTFGIPGAFVEEEKHIDYESTWNKWGAAIGGLGGFVLGAPAKVLGKVAMGATKAAIKVAGKETGEAFTKRLLSQPASHLSKSTVKEAGKIVTNLSRSPHTQTMTNSVFRDKATKHIGQLLTKKVASKEITSEQAATVGQLFKDNLTEMPIGDMANLLMKTTGLSPRVARGLGRMYGETAGFAVVDSIFEGFSVIEDGQYDLTAPVWGAATGALFGTLGFLNPVGKGNKWFTDWKTGVRNAFSSEVNYAKMGSRKLGTMANFFGQQLERTPSTLKGKPTGGYRSAQYTIVGDNGKKAIVNLTADPKHIKTQLKEAFGKNWKKELSSILNKERRQYGRDLVTWANKQGVENLRKHWFHMMAGGMVFNARTFYEAYANDIELDFAGDILPHFLIGAALQVKHGQKLSLDFTNQGDINRFRQGLAILERNPELKQLNNIPTFAIQGFEADNPFITDPNKYAKTIELAKELGIINDEIVIIDDVADARLRTLGTSQDMNTMEIYSEIHQYLRPLARHRRGFNKVTERDAKRLIEQFKEENPNVKLEKVSDFIKVLDEASIRGSEQFERTFSDIMLELKKTKLNDELGDVERSIVYNEDLNSTEKNVMPENFILSESLRLDAKEGKLEWLTDADGNKMSGKKAIRALDEAIDGYGKVVETNLIIDKASLLKGKVTSHTIKNENSIRDLYITIKKWEGIIDQRLPNKSLMFSEQKFSFFKNWDDYSTIVFRNDMIRNMRKSSDIFEEGFSDRDELLTKLKQAKIIDKDADFSIYGNVDHVEITGTEDSSKLSQARRRLQRIHSLVSTSLLGRKTAMKVILNAQASKDKVDIKTINGLVTFLKDSGLNIKFVKGNFFRTFENYLLRERIEGSTLSISDMDTALELTRSNFGSFKPNESGVNSIVLQKVKITKDMQQKTDAQEYNTIIQDIADRSNGLIQIDKNRIVVSDADTMTSLYSMARSSESGAAGLSVRSAITDFVNSLHADNRSVGKLIAAAVNEGEQSKVFSWLIKSGVLVRNTDNRNKPYEINGKLTDKDGLIKLNEIQSREIKKLTNQFGIGAEYADTLHKRMEKEAKALIDQDGKITERNLSLQEFYTKYGFEDYTEFVGGEVELSEIAKNQEKHFNNLIYDGGTVDIKTVKDGLVENILDNIYVKKSNSLVKYSDLSRGDKVKRKREIIRDLWALLGSKRNQTEVNVIKNDYRDLEASTEKRQSDKFIESFRDELGLDFWFIDPSSYQYDLSADSKSLTLRYWNIFEYASDKISENQRNKLREEYDLFVSNLNVLGDTRLMSIVDESSRVDIKQKNGWEVIRIAPEMSPIAIHRAELHKLIPALEKIVERFGEDERVSADAKKTMKRLLKEISKESEDGTKIFDDTTTKFDVQDLVEMVYFERMLRGKDGREFFIENYLNNKDSKASDKLRKRVKLFNTPNFVRYDKALVNELLQESTQKSKDSMKKSILKRNNGKGGWNIAIWRDEKNHSLKDMIDSFLEKNPDIKWDYEQIMGNTHQGRSEFDSIAFVSRDALRAAHTLLGHNPESYNPIKPVISSSGDNAPLLYGKTLFVHTPSMNKFFKANPNVDIILAESGAKITNAKASTEQFRDEKYISNRLVDGKLTPIKSEDLNESLILKREQIYELPLDAVGLKPEKDKDITTAKRSQADYNFVRNEEARRIWEDDYSVRITTELDKMRKLFSDPIKLRAVMFKGEGDLSLSSEMAELGSTAQLFGMDTYLSLSKFADPMSYSERMTMSKLYSKHFDYIMNGYRSTLDIIDKGHMDTRYGGQAPLMQEVSGFGRDLRPTLVDRDGRFQSRGEILLPSYEAESLLSRLKENDYEIKITRGKHGQEVQSLKDFVEKDGTGFFEAPKDWTKNKYDFLIDSDITLGKLWERLNQYNKAKKENIQIGIVARRNPRTRPNDMTILSLKGFLKQRHGNSQIINPFDVVNVYEGDYDYDKADYFFAHRKSMYDHIERSSAHFVQGVDPTKFNEYIAHDFSLDASTRYSNMERIWANGSVFSKSIGRVQKIPRGLNFLSHVGLQSTTDSVSKAYNKEFGRTPHTLWQDGRSRIIMDYDNYNFYQRMALETQLMIDASIDVDGSILKDITTYNDKLLFPTDNVIKLETTRDQIGFIKDVRNSSRADIEELSNKRVEIFKKVREGADGELEYVPLNPAEKAIIKTMMSEYNKLLNVSGNMTFENGNQRPAKYQDISDASERFFNFFSNPSDKIFYNLRYQYVNMDKPNEGKWIDNEYFKNIFKPVKAKKGYHVPKRSIWDAKLELSPAIEDNIKGIAGGTRGNILERAFYQLREKDPMNLNRHTTSPSDIAGLIDGWYIELMSRNNSLGNSSEMSPKELEEMFDHDAINTAKALKNINGLASSIQSLKKKWSATQRNNKLSYKNKKKISDGINDQVESLQEKLGTMITKKFKKTGKGLDLKKMTTVSVEDSEDMMRGSIQFGTIHNIRKAYGFASLNTDASEGLRILKKLRQGFYGNLTKWGEWYEYGQNRTILPRELKDFLKNVKDMSDFYEVEGKLLDYYIYEKGHGLAFLWEYMSPVDNKFAVGVHNGNPVEAPYGKTGRYSRGLQYLSQVGNPQNGKYAGKTNDARAALTMLQMIEHNINNFYRKKIDMKYEQGSVIRVKDESTGTMTELNISDLALPDFHRDFRTFLNDYDAIRWTSTTDKIVQNFDVINDHMYDFYKSIIELQGMSTSEYDSYVSVLNDMRSVMISNRTLNPYEYITIMNSLNGEMRELTKSVFAKGLDSFGNDVAARSLRSNPVYVLMGGETAWSNSLEKRPLDTQRQIQNAADLRRVTNDMKDNVKQTDSKETFDQIIKDCKII